MKKVVFKTAILAALIAIAIPIGYVYYTCNNWKSIAYPGVYIENINVSGKTLVEVEEILKNSYTAPLLLKKIEIEASGKVYTLDYAKLNAKYNISEIAQQAFSYGKQGNTLDKYNLIKSKKLKEFKLGFTYSSTPIDDIVEIIEKESKKESADAKISIINGIVNVTPEVNGVSLQKENFKKMIIDKIDGDAKNEIITIVAPLDVSKPEITAAKLSANYVLLSSFSTSFSTSISNRITNIELATKAINGTVLMPGETFSFNKQVGERTRQKGYKEAGIIIGDKIESGLGGGICQVSSTLYNTLLQSNINASERRNHSLPLGYIAKGLDATVDFGNIDLKFENTLSSPIYIEGYIKNKNVYFNIYSNEEYTKRSYKTVTNVYETVLPTIKYTDDPTRLIGETEVVKLPANGYKVKVYRQIFENEKLIDTELISTDYYNPIHGETIRGTKPKIPVIIPTPEIPVVPVMPVVPIVPVVPVTVVAA